MTDTPALIALTPAGLVLARRIAQGLPRAELHGLAGSVLARGLDAVRLAEAGEVLRSYHEDRAMGDADERLRD